MSNVIVVSEEELETLIQTARDRAGLSNAAEIKWNEKIEHSKKPIFLGRAEDGMAVYQLQFTL